MAKKPGQDDRIDKIVLKSFAPLAFLLHIKNLLKFTIYITIAVIYFSFPVHAFYEYQGDQNSFELRGLLRPLSLISVNPDNKTFYKNDIDVRGGGIGRLLLDARIGNHAALEFNGYQIINSSTAAAVVPDSQGTSLGDVERTSALEWKQIGGSELTTNLAVDRLNVRLTYHPVDIIIGRQPINIATQFYFTPNDFFAPFTAQTFYRVYKSGVDATRVEVQLGALSQLSFISVLGYSPVDSSSNGWSAKPDLSRTSFFSRIATTMYNFEWALLGGTVTDKNIIGASLQGELFEWLGLRAEGHYAMPENDAAGNYAEFTVGLEHQFPNDIDLRSEFFHHGPGASSNSDYKENKLVLETTLPYLARRYLAIGGGYQATPLLHVSSVAVLNLIDGSDLFSFNAAYSLSDEAELSLGLIIPIGKHTSTNSNTTRSEFGLYPYSANIEVRIYF